MSDEEAAPILTRVMFFHLPRPKWQAAVKAVFFTIQDYFAADIANIILYGFVFQN